MGYSVNMPTSDRMPDELVDPGTYRAVIKDVKVSFSRKDGSTFCAVTWELTDKRQVEDVWPLEHPKMGWKSSVYQKAAGLPHVGQMEIEPGDWKGTEADITVKHNVYQGKTRAQVNEVEGTGRKQTEAPPAGFEDEPIPF